MSLALRLGFRSRMEMLRELSARQITEWRVYFQLEDEYIRERRMEADLEREAVSGLERLIRRE